MPFDFRIRLFKLIPYDERSEFKSGCNLTNGHRSHWNSNQRGTEVKLKNYLIINDIIVRNPVFLNKIQKFVKKELFDK